MSAAVVPIRRPEVSEEEFLAWRDDPVTQWVMAACRKAAEQCKDRWEQLSWEQGECSPLVRTELHTLADAYMALEQTEYAGWLRTHEEDQ